VAGESGWDDIGGEKANMESAAVALGSEM